MEKDRNVRIKDIGEFAFIDRIKQGCIFRPEHIIKGIGDDAAVLRIKGDGLTIVTTDLMVEGVHFRRQTTSSFDLGYKSIAVNLSDIAAMGGYPREAFVSMAIPADWRLDELEKIYDGMKQLAGEFDVNILGGDTTASGIGLIINIAIMGYVSEKNLLKRDGAKPGDLIFTTGFLGDSKAGLYLLKNKKPLDNKKLKSLVKSHNRPYPHLKQAWFLSEYDNVHSAIDISDGLLLDLNHIVKSSKVGARVYPDKLPISLGLKKVGDTFGLDPVKFALAGGEDYVLLVTIDVNKAEEICVEFENKFREPLYQIGEIVEGNKIDIIGKSREIEMNDISYWKHF